MTYTASAFLDETDPELQIDGDYEWRACIKENGLTIWTSHYLYSSRADAVNEAMAMIKTLKEGKMK